MVMGVDLVAVDATCCRLMKLPAERIPTLVLAAQMKLGRLAEAEHPAARRADREVAHKPSSGRRRSRSSCCRRRPRREAPASKTRPGLYCDRPEGSRLEPGGRPK